MLSFGFTVQRFKGSKVQGFTVNGRGVAFMVFCCESVTPAEDRLIPYRLIPIFSPPNR